MQYTDNIVVLFFIQIDHFNSLDKDNIKSHNYICFIYLIQLNLDYRPFGQPLKMTRIDLF